MKTLSFYIVDVFAEEKYAGNQLAVFRSGDGLSDAEMQRIAREMNFSETTFILSETPVNGGFNVRIFTPGAEVPFAGHPTLGTAHIIRREIFSETREIRLNLKVGQIPVTFGESSEPDPIYWMKQPQPEFRESLPPEIVAPVLGLKPNEVDRRFPVQEVSTGLPHILVPLRTLASLKRARVVKEKYFELVENRWAKPILIFCPEPHRTQNDLSVRMFADWFGVSEDPATGSGNGCLAAYLVRHRYRGTAKIDIRTEQGYEIGRPSLLFLKSEERDGTITVSVGGKAITIARGEFL